MRFRRLAAGLMFAALTIASVNPVLIRMPFDDRNYMHDAFVMAPDGAWFPNYPAFLRDVRAATKPGDTIALAVSNMKWDDGYSYAYYRASYILSGREVLPLISPDDARIPANFRRAQYIAAWRVRIAGMRQVGPASHDGVLLAR
jgi:hypothetical protein